MASSLSAVSLQLTLKLLGSSAVALAVFFGYHLIYNLYFHPLRKVPGPPLARVSRLWSRLGNRKGEKSHRVHAAHQRYGSVVRVGPSELSFSNPAAVREIYTSSDLVKEETFYRAKRVFHEEMLMSIRDPAAHTQRRKMWSRGFSQAAMQAFEPNVAWKVKTLLDQWESRTRDGSSIDVYPWTLMLGFDIVYHLMFDEDPGSVRNGRPHEVMKYLRAWKPTYIYKEFIPQMERWGVYVPGHIGGYFRDVREWKHYAMDIVRRVRLQGTKTPFLSYMLGDQDHFLGRPLTDSEVAEECMGGMFGGSGTTANTFVYLLWATLQNPQVKQTLQTELQTAFPDRDTVPDSVRCTQLPYLNAVIDETLRRYPTIIATLPRTATRDLLIDGVPIPKGTVVGTQNYTIHRDPAAFPDPESFRPERWLEDDENNNASTSTTTAGNKQKEAFTPFSLGPRRCVGITLAQMELRVLTAAFFRRFDTAAVDWTHMTHESMEMFDQFSAAPRGGKLVLKLGCRR